MLRLLLGLACGGEPRSLRRGLPDLIQNLTHQVEDLLRVLRTDWIAQVSRRSSVAHMSNLVGLVCDRGTYEPSLGHLINLRSNTADRDLLTFRRALHHSACQSDGTTVRTESVGDVAARRVLPVALPDSQPIAKEI